MPIKEIYNRLMIAMKRCFETAWFLFCNYLMRWTRCSTERLGSEYGAWTICPSTIDPESIVYSVGVGKDITFDIGLIEKYGCSIFAFDPTPGAVEWLKHQKLPPQFRWFELGLANYNGEAKFFPPENPEFISHTILEKLKIKGEPIRVPVQTLGTIAQGFGHSRIDLLKMDIEGAEYAVLDNILSTKLDVNQILVEFHHFFPGIGVLKTIRSTFILILKGYKLFAISPSRHEYSFLKDKG